LHLFAHVRDSSQPFAVSCRNYRRERTCEQFSRYHTAAEAWHGCASKMAPKGFGVTSRVTSASRTTESPTVIRIATDASEALRVRPSLRAA
jgi:hypothetical protein